MADQNTYWANPNLRLYRTEVSLEDPVNEMRPGMSCAIEILVEDIQDALYVPVQSVFRRAEDTLAFVVHGGEGEERSVEVGRYNDRWVQVVSGLQEGETVLLTPPADFTQELEEARSAVGDGAAGTAPVAAEASPQASGTDAVRSARPEGAPGGEGRRERVSSEDRGGREGRDPARAEEYRKRFEGMSEEEKAKALESFRGRRGEGGESRGGGENRGGAGGGG